jgi:hypothetical protein
MRIAAANIARDPAGSIAYYIDRLQAGDRLAELAVEGSEDISLSAAFRLSYAALPRAERRVFRLLGDLSGPDLTTQEVTLLGGEVGTSEAARLLAKLADAHVLRRLPAGRFQVHELIRRYARQRNHEYSTATRQHGPPVPRAAPLRPSTTPLIAGGLDTCHPLGIARSWTR